MKIPLWLLGPALLMVLPGGVHSARAADPAPGHSLHGETFNEGPRQAAVLMEGIPGAVAFPVTTKSDEAQRFFNQGVGQLHGFWYFEAERSFRQAAALDADCAMAYWGMAMANVNNEERARGFLEKAVERKDQASAREQLWIGALEHFYRKDDKRSKKDRELELIRDLELLVQDDPQDVEAKAFLVWRIWAARDEAPISSYQAADALLDQIFAVSPMHPAHHYRIHLWDQQKAERALSSAALCGQSGPGIAHLWHMPGHTYSKLKRFDDAAWQQEASSRVDHAYMIRNLVMPDQIHNYAHNEEWLIRTYNELGRAGEAQALARSLIEIPRHPKFNTLEKNGSSASFGRTRLLDTLVTWELWEQLLGLNGGAYLEPVRHADHEARRLRALALAHYHFDDQGGIEEVLLDLEALQRNEQEKKKRESRPDPDKATKKSTEESGEPAGETSASGKGAARGVGKEKRSELSKALAEVEVLKKLIVSDPEAAGALEKAAPDIPGDRLARYWLRLGEQDKAVAQAVKLPQTVAGDLVRLEILLEASRKGQARTVFNRLQSSAAGMDENLPASRRMEKFATEWGVDGGWRKPAPPATDAGRRPDQKTLGPLRWHPPRAPDWRGTGLEGETVDSRSFAPGRPLLILFYLGHECIHCMQQVIAFAEKANAFEAAGISIVAISAESSAELPGALERSATPGSLPFPILADAELESFRNYRSHDDFEDMAMHTVAFVDGAGRLRWIDTGYDPFDDVEFLLRECRRLMIFSVHP